MVSSSARVMVLWAVGTLAAAGPAAALEPIRIMPVGDSITVGYTNLPGQQEVPFEFGYRSGLYTRLTDADYSFQFIGSSAERPALSPGCPNCPDITALNQDYHNGYGGTGVSWTSSRIASWIQADNPDVILLMTGINSIPSGSSGNPIDAENQLNGLVRRVVGIKPAAHLIIAQITPYSTYADSIVQYNNYIKNTLVPYYASQGKLVSTVDQYSNFLTNGAIDPTLFSNQINHPSPVGYDRIAQTWFQGVQALGTITHTPLPQVSVPSLNDHNVLSNKPVVASSVYNASFNPSYATDGTVNDQLFRGTLDGGTDADMGLVIHGISSGFDLVRIWQDVDDPNRVPARVTIRSSASDTTSLDAASFETALASVSNLVFDAVGYVDISVNAPANTRSLLLDFGGVDSQGDPYGVRIQEVQAFATAEPSTMVALVCGAVSALGYGSWRRITGICHKRGSGSRCVDL